MRCRPATARLRPEFVGTSSSYRVVATRRMARFSRRAAFYSRHSRQPRLAETPNGLGTQMDADERGYGTDAPTDKGTPTDTRVHRPPSVGVPLSVGEIRCRPATARLRPEFVGNPSPCRAVAATRRMPRISTMRATSNLLCAAVVLCLSALSLADDRGIEGVREAWLTKTEQDALGNYYGLVIGINRYEHFPPLNTAATDARAVAKVLKSSYGFKDVMLLVDAMATDKAIKDALFGLRAKVTKNDSLLIYFAGHGVLIGGLGYWIPTNAQADSDAQWVENSLIRGRLAPDWLPAKHVLIVADSCYSGTLLRSVSKGETVTAPYLKQAMRTCARQCLSSGGLYPVPDGTSSHSIFARYFLKALEDPPARVFVPSDIFPRIRDNTALNAPEVERGKPQTPILGVLKEAGHEVGGEFVFFYRGALAPPPP
ncbi:MAG: caspase family protein, partial [Planctomycetes bacterium]|nr:caspase family protein [Planctomycetota bacterium]